MRRINNQVRQRRRQTWLDLPAHGIEEVGHGSRSEGPLSEERRRGRIANACHIAGTQQALADLMAWYGIEEQGEEMTLMIHHLHALGPQKSAPMLTPPVLLDYRLAHASEQATRSRSTTSGS